MKWLLVYALSFSAVTVVVLSSDCRTADDNNVDCVTSNGLEGVCVQGTCVARPLETYNDCANSEDGEQCTCGQGVDGVCIGKYCNCVKHTRSRRMTRCNSNWDCGSSCSCKNDYCCCPNHNWC